MIYNFIIKPVFGLDAIYYSICYYTTDCNHLICVAVHNNFSHAWENLSHYTSCDNTFLDVELTKRYCGDIYEPYRS